jgi:DNA-binding transcriptional LysR family regulator
VLICLIDLGRNVALTWLDELIHAHPKLSIQLNIIGQVADLYQDSIDVALRYGQPVDSNMVAFSLAKVESVACVAPSYLNQKGVP